MKIEYDAKADAVYIRLSSGKVADRDDVRPNVFLDADENGRVLVLKCWTSANSLTSLMSWHWKC